ncbi:alpha/beta hydrolase family protein [Caulobacter segnis]|uniref:alpha/beta hydrolase family protein n=1 Tax=Caulobacter segnis TaxID=88688 RepID=UPI001CBF27C8|nr:acetylxylan esterase [Caulobacter segnis]UAL09588.1 acetylxylan esterase [Caulobacter segnis]
MLVRSILQIACAAGLLAGAPAFAQTPQRDVAAGQAEHARMLKALGITRPLRPGVDGYNKTAPNAVNYDEAKAGPFSLLPDPLAFPDGRPVPNGEAWWKARRPQLVAAFDSEVYGRVPKHAPKITWTVVKETKTVRAGVPVVEKRLAGVADNSRAPAIKVSLDLLVVTPEGQKGVPLILELGFPDGPPWARNRPPPPGPGPSYQDWRDLVLAKGWGYAILDPTSVQADDPARLNQGIIGLANRGHPRKSDDWGALRAWAWGASRAIDYFESDPAIDAQRVGIEGLSRYGKAALVAMAYEPRLAVGLIASSGEGGAKLHRRQRGEQVENLAAEGEHHWMSGEFLKYAGPLTADDLPVDAHELIALVAPRPLFISVGNDEADAWTDPRGMFMATVAAGPVYRLLGARDLEATTYPAPLTLLATGDLAFRQHEGGHTPGPNWPYFLAFAGRYLGK